MWSIVLQPASENESPTAAATVSCTFLECDGDGTGSTDPDGSILAYSWDFGDGTAPATGSNPEHTYAEAGTYTVGLTVTDNGGSLASTTTSVTVEAPPPPSVPITFVGGATSAVNASNHTVSTPAGTEAGDGLLLFASSNNPSATMSAPTGGGTWTLLETVDTGGIVTRVWKATAADAGSSTVGITTSSFSKVALTVLVYNGTGADPVAAFAAAPETATTANHATPSASVAAPGSFVVSYWAQKDSSSGALTAPAGVTTRSAGSVTGSGRIVALAADSGAEVAPGPYGGLVATAPATSRNATMWTIVLRPS
jgi:PKD repeat protein